MLFITIACGACSGFHSLIASGTTSKQLRKETDARPIGYGTMLLEAMVAIVSLACVMVLAGDSKLASQPPNFIYALGMGRFLEILGVPATIGVSFASDGIHNVRLRHARCLHTARTVHHPGTHGAFSGTAGGWLGTTLTAGIPLVFLLRPHVDAAGNAVPVWKTFWSLFGASNQLLAALTLLGVTVWLWRTRRESLGLAGDGRADRVHVCDEHMGAGQHDAAEIPECQRLCPAGRSGAVGGTGAPVAGRRDARRGDPRARDAAGAAGWAGFHGRLTTRGRRMTAKRSRPQAVSGRKARSVQSR
jgi:carbon starvation protein CstA